MKKVIDISKYLDADVPQIVLFGKTYSVKSDKKTILLLNELQRKLGKSDGLDADTKILELLMGKESAAEVIKVLEENPNYTSNERAIMLNVMALATGTTYEELEERFQKATK